MTDDLEPRIHALAAALGETDPQPVQTIRAIVTHLGIDAAQRYLQRTQEIEAAGGLRTQDGHRRRTPGGVFFHLVKQDLYAQEQHPLLHAIFPHAPRPRAAPSRPIVLPKVWHGRKPDQSSINAILDHFLGTPPDLYRRSIHPTTGATTLHFSFPDIAQERYREQIAQAAAVAEVAITVAPAVHQGQMQQMARSLLPSSITAPRIGIHQEQRTVRVRGTGHISHATLATIQQTFRTSTGWHLDLDPTITIEEPADTRLPDDQKGD